jgi:hypothetical protein
VHGRKKNDRLFKSGLFLLQKLNITLILLISLSYDASNHHYTIHCITDEIANRLDEHSQLSDYMHIEEEILKA